MIAILHHFKMQQLNNPITVHHGKVRYKIYYLIALIVDLTQIVLLFVLLVMTVLYGRILKYSGYQKIYQSKWNRNENQSNQTSDIKLSTRETWKIRTIFLVIVPASILFHCIGWMGFKRHDYGAIIAFETFKITGIIITSINQVSLSIILFP